MITDKKLDFWIKNNLNVLIEGRHGTGKSSMIIDAVTRNNLKWLYYSASTMDVFTDFLGVPKEKVDINGKSYLEFIQPKQIADDDVEFIFFDEFNRAKSKVTNAVMELIQFKSLNGKKFKNLKMIWAAINPDGTDDEYAVEKLDPAHKDRFHIIVKANDKPDTLYFRKKYQDNGKIIIDWWNSLPKEIKNDISPRRLDYALDVYNLGGDISDVLPYEANSKALIFQLSTGSISDKIKSYIAQKNNPNEQEIKKDFSNENFYNVAIEIILKQYKSDLLFFGKYLPEEKFSKLLLSNNEFKNQVLSSSSDDIEYFTEPLLNILKAKTAKRKLLTEIRTFLSKNNEIPKAEILLGSILDYLPNNSGKWSSTKYDLTKSVENRRNITVILTNLATNDWDNLSLTDLTNIMIINCIVGALTYGNLWTDTIKIFDMLENVCKKNHQTSLKDLYHKIMIIPEFINSISAQQRQRINGRLLNKGYIK